MVNAILGTLLYPYSATVSLAVQLLAPSETALHADPVVARMVALDTAADVIA